MPKVTAKASLKHDGQRVMPGDRLEVASGDIDRMVAAGLIEQPETPKPPEKKASRKKDS